MPHTGLYVQAYFERLHGFNLDSVGIATTIYIPKANVLDEAAVRQFAQFKHVVLGQMKGVSHHEGQNTNL